jgi:hypothetical protein
MRTGKVLASNPLIVSPAAPPAAPGPESPLHSRPQANSAVPSFPGRREMCVWYK